MALLPIVTVPDRRLRERCKPVADVTDEHRQQLENMLDTMYKAPGIGLAGPQVGIMERILVLDPADEGEEPQPFKIINPEIVWASEAKSSFNEGCLSIPEQYAEIERPAKVAVKFLDEEGKSHEIECEGMLATIIQHEMDHLDGVLFVDYLSKLRKNMLIKKAQKYMKTHPSDEYAEG
ncbi:MAG: peptide deformylase [Alphaproteobacteria bacterium]|nr:peptide deformylase [Alphaproteobacteria bacterium SS10]